MICSKCGAEGIYSTDQVVCNRCQYFYSHFYPILDDCFKWDTRLGIPKSMYKCSLENFDGKRPVVTPGFISGPVGTGKTHLAIGYIRKEIGLLWSDRELYFDFELKENSSKFKTQEEFRFDNVLNTVSFISAWRFVQQMKELDTASATRKRYEELNFLVLDDLGMTRPTDYALDVLSNLILSRHEDARKTLITSNINLDELNKMFGNRIISRIVGSGDCLTLTGKDRRAK